MLIKISQFIKLNNSKTGFYCINVKLKIFGDFLLKYDLNECSVTVLPSILHKSNQIKPDKTTGCVPTNCNLKHLKDFFSLNRDFFKHL